LTARELQPERIYVLRGLHRNGGHNSKQVIPPTLGRLERRVSPRLYVVRLRMGHFKKWAPKPRFASLSNFEREATPREITLGWPAELGRTTEAA
jgi:hypothetical protein